MRTHIHSISIKSIIRLASVLLLLGVGVASGNATEITEYIFSSKTWKAKLYYGGDTENWSNGKSGSKLSGGQGIQVTTESTGANATSPRSFTNVARVVVTYNTNQSAGAGNIAIQIGSNAAVSHAVSYSGSGDGRHSFFTSTYDFATPQSGKVKFTVNVTTNSIYLYSIEIFYGNTAAYTVTYDAGNGTCATSSAAEAFISTGVTLPVATPTKESHTAGWGFYGWATAEVGSPTTNIPTIVGKAGDTYYPSSNVTLHAVYAKGEYTKVTSTEEITSGSRYIIAGYYDDDEDDSLDGQYVMTGPYVISENLLYHNMQNRHIDDDNGKYAAAAVHADWCYTITGTPGAYFIRDVIHSSESNYLDIYWEDDWHSFLYCSSVDFR